MVDRGSERAVPLVRLGLRKDAPRWSCPLRRLAASGLSIGLSWEVNRLNQCPRDRGKLEATHRNRGQQKRFDDQARGLCRFMFGFEIEGSLRPSSASTCSRHRHWLAAASFAFYVGPPFFLPGPGRSRSHDFAAACASGACEAPSTNACPTTSPFEPCLHPIFEKACRFGCNAVQPIRTLRRP